SLRSPSRAPRDRAEDPVGSLTEEVVVAEFRSRRGAAPLIRDRSLPRDRPRNRGPAGHLFVSAMSFSARRGLTWVTCEPAGQGRHGGYRTAFWATPGRSRCGEE